LEDAIALIQRINPKKAYLTHVSHKLGFHKEIQRSLPKNIFLAYDGLEIEIN
jgi:phosphoribosyl 1,2-cyclic phosphate phosphodiesterase